MLSALALLYLNNHRVWYDLADEPFGSLGRLKGVGAAKGMSELIPVFGERARSDNVS
jgi:hypothetical protein